MRPTPCDDSRQGALWALKKQDLDLPRYRTTPSMTADNRQLEKHHARQAGGHLQVLTQGIHKGQALYGPVQGCHQI